MNGLQFWPVWMFGVSAGVLWGLPRLPHYHVDLPYIYDLGGCAVVAWYMGLGFLSLGCYILSTEALRRHACRHKRVDAVLTGGVAFMLAGGFWGLYHVLLEMSVNIS